ncbi:MAG TPA: SUF system NifU family Fe-S cluster assembly protein [Chloroflexota bacterium]|nr:SUF system NifU family Fe-S cluster assembly protein [Chloroflexota bacterium]
MVTTNPLYHDIILEHYEYPRNKGTCECPDATSRGRIAMCGDDLSVSLRLDEDGQTVEEVCWDGHACAIGEASASMMTETVKARSKAEARRWYRTMRGLVTGRTEEMDPALELGDLESLEGIKQYPIRVKCALLAWEALDEALSIAEKKKRGAHG